MKDVKQAAFSPGEVATMLGISRQQVYRLMRRGELDSRKIGSSRSRRIFPNHLAELVGDEEAEALARFYDE